MLIIQLRTLQEKLNWIFDVFDTDGSGSIDQSELHNIVHGLFCMAGIEVPPEVLVARSEVSQPISNMRIAGRRRMMAAIILRRCEESLIRTGMES